MKTAIVEPQSSPPLPRSNLPMLYYGLVVVATVAIMLVLYNLVVVKWCADQRPPQRSSPSAWRIISSVRVPILIFDGGSDSECAICLSVFEQGEQMRQLPKCHHCFHAPCIDMWLYSHFDCPLCRSPVEHHHHVAAVESDHSRQEFLV